jgi:pyridinium-3,5-biscarboxylic acid mononucleotide sulfurtransferase
MSPGKKLAFLKKIISGYGSCLVAFSGGVDSTLLLKVSGLVLPKEKLLAVTGYSHLRRREELLLAKRIAKRLKVRHKIIKTSEMEDKKFLSNAVDRCYLCKKKLFLKLKALAKNNNLKFILEASTVSDIPDFRPGNKAKIELNIRSPLLEAGLIKEDVRNLSRRLNLITWNKPSDSCLASRIPYGVKLTPSLLKRINRAESFLNSLGFRQVRVRHYNGLCRIEVPKKDIPRLLKKEKNIARRMRKLGYQYITVDLEGYRTGSMNELLNDRCRK